MWQIKIIFIKLQKKRYNGLIWIGEFRYTRWWWLIWRIKCHWCVRRTVNYGLWSNTKLWIWKSNTAKSVVTYLRLFWLEFTKSPIHVVKSKFVAFTSDIVIIWAKSLASKQTSLSSRQKRKRHGPPIFRLNIRYKNENYGSKPSLHGRQQLGWQSSCIYG